MSEQSSKPIYKLSRSELTGDCVVAVGEALVAVEGTIQALRDHFKVELSSIVTASKSDHEQWAAFTSRFTKLLSGLPEDTTVLRRKLTEALTLNIWRDLLIKEVFPIIRGHGGAVSLPSKNTG
jgi:hypothetical protein